MKRSGSLPPFSEREGLSQAVRLARGAREAKANAQGTGSKKAVWPEAGEDWTLEELCLRVVALQKSIGGVGLREA